MISIIDHQQNNNANNSIQEFNGALVKLGQNPNELDRNIYLGCIYLSKLFPALLKNTTIENTLISFFGCKKSPLLPLLSANLLYYSYLTVDEWPKTFIQIYLSDALTNRVWVKKKKSLFLFFFTFFFFNKLFFKYTFDYNLY